MRFVDSSIFLCSMLKKPAQHYQACRELLRQIRDGEVVVETSIMSFAEIIWVLESREGFTRNVVLEKVTAISSFKGLKAIPIGDSDLPLEAMSMSARFDVDFVDAVSVLIMRREGIREIYSLDRHYDNLRKPFGIKRLVPESRVT